jgi:hypothetical protein
MALVSGSFYFETEQYQASAAIFFHQPGKAISRLVAGRPVNPDAAVGTYTLVKALGDV